MRSLLALLPVFLAVAGCSREEEPVANRFERQKAEIEEKARTYEAQVENEVSAAEARLQNEVDVMLQNQAPPVEANAADDNRSR